MREKKIEFMPTDDLKEQIGNVPVGTRLELMTQYDVKENGKWCMVSIEGVPMPGYDSEGNPTGDKKDYMEGGKFVSSYQDAMKGGMEGY